MESSLLRTVVMGMVMLSLPMPTFKGREDELQSKVGPPREQPQNGLPLTWT